MIGVVCTKCRTLHEVGKECPTCRQKWNKQYNDKKRDKKVQGFYLGKEWHIIRASILDYYCGVDIWKLGLTGKLEPCKRPIVHHIYPYQKYPHMALAKHNLVSVSSESHVEIHEWYNTGRFNKAVEVINKGKQKYKEIQDGKVYTFGESGEE